MTLPFSQFPTALKADIRFILTDIDDTLEAGFAGDLAGYRRHLMEDKDQYLPSAQALRERIEILSKRNDSLIPEYFGVIPLTTYGVRLIPPEAVAEKMPPAYAQPNPAGGSTAGVHWVTSLPEKCPRHSVGNVHQSISTAGEKEKYSDSKMKNRVSY